MGGTNPPLILCDTDVVIQLFVARSVAPLKCLRDRFGVQPTVMPEVDVELTSQPGSEVARRFRGAAESGLIRTLDVPMIRALRSSLPKAIAEDSPDAIWERILDLGHEYERYVDMGESYTYAAALTLDLPVTSNDRNAIDTLGRHGVPVPIPVLRAFDLIAFGVQSGEMGVADADEMRSRLQRADEGVPRVFANCGFDAGIQQFRPRLLDASRACHVRPDDNALRLHPI